MSRVIDSPANLRSSVRPRINIERGTLVMLVLFVLSLPFITPRVAASDEIEYFSYLPSLVFDHDLDFRNQYEHFCNLDPQNCTDSRFRETFLELKTPTGLQINFAPLGTALLWLPFYLAGHLVALLLQSINPALAADGYSLPYLYAVCLGSVFFGWLGIYLSYKIARGYFAEWIALASALVILFATNAVYYFYVAPAFSHAASLFASALFVYIWWRTRASRLRGDLRSWIVLGLSGGLMSMVREQEAVFFIIPLAESAFVWWSARRAGTGIGSAPVRNVVRGLLTMFVSALVVFIPQLVVYYTLNGNFFPAHNVTEKFTWDGAHIGDILFSNFHGLFTWTPIVLLSLVGLFFLWRHDRVMTFAFAVALAAETFLLGSFSTWFGGAAFGMRRYVNCTVIFVIGLAALVDALAVRVPRPALLGAGALFVVWNLFFIIQFVTGMVPRQEPIDMLVMARNQFVAVPPQLAEIAVRFVTARESFFRR